MCPIKLFDRSSKVGQLIFTGRRFHWNICLTISFIYRAKLCATSFMRQTLSDEILSSAIQLGNETLSCPTKLELLLDLCGLDLVVKWIEFIYLLVGHIEMLAICS